MRPGPESPLDGFRRALAQRTRYLILTGRLSGASGREMEGLSQQMALLELVIGPRLTAGRPLMRKLLTDAYVREVRRRGELVLADAREARRRGRGLRERAGAVRREGMRGRLHLVAEPAQIDLSSLERVAARWAGTG